MGFLRDDAFWSATPTLLSAVISVTPVLLPSRPLPCKQFPLRLPRSSLLQHAVICHLSSTIHRPRRTLHLLAHVAFSPHSSAASLYGMSVSFCIVIWAVCFLLRSRGWVGCGVSSFHR